MQSQRDKKVTEDFTPFQKKPEGRSNTIVGKLANGKRIVIKGVSDPPVHSQPHVYAGSSVSQAGGDKSNSSKGFNGISYQRIKQCKLQH